MGQQMMLWPWAPTGACLYCVPLSGAHVPIPPHHDATISKKPTLAMILKSQEQCSRKMTANPCTGLQSIWVKIPLSDSLNLLGPVQAGVGCP